MQSKYFKIEELVSHGVYKRYGNGAWKFLSPQLLSTIDAIREHFNKPMIINNWCFGGNLQQRGLRANKDELVKGKKDYYVSQHCLGNAVDFNIKNLTPKEVFDEIIKYKHKFPYLTRIEDAKDTPTWVHIDCANVDEFTIFNGK